MQQTINHGSTMWSHVVEATWVIESKVLLVYLLISSICSCLSFIWSLVGAESSGCYTSVWYLGVIEATNWIWSLLRRWDLGIFWTIRAIMLWCLTLHHLHKLIRLWRQVYMMEIYKMSNRYYSILLQISSHVVYLCSPMKEHVEQCQWKLETWLC